MNQPRTISSNSSLNQSLSCLVIDDDAMARKALHHLIDMTDSLEWLGECSDAVKAIDLIRSQAADVLFLDVEMPDMSGLELIDIVPDHQKIVLVSGRHEYAVQAFELEVVDYLLKPVTPSRFFRTVNRLIETQLPEPTSPPVPIASLAPDHVFVKDKGVMVRLKLDDVWWIEALGDYVQFVTEEKKYTVHSSMKNILSKLSPKQFLRVHRSYIINLDKIATMEDNTLTISTKLIPIGKSYRKEVGRVLNVL